MGTNHAKSKPALGFLTVLEHPQHGLFGGYLLLNHAGRPVEFHCTTPIKPNRAQEILYGPTLESFLYGEQIGQTLLETAKSEVCFVCTDRYPALAVREHVAMPVALVLADEAASEDPEGGFRRIDAAHPPVPGCSNPKWGELNLIAFELGRNRLAVPERSENDQRLIAELFSDLAGSFDLAEPFARIREAIREAQQAVR